jgi:ADP-ribose pyrophosphatase
MNIQPPQSKQPLPPHAKRVFKGKVFDVYQWEQELYDGTKTIFEKLKRPDTVAVFAVLPDGKILLTKQEQPGNKPFIAATSGRVDEGEDVVSAAKRELLEESGYEAQELFLWNAQQPVSKIEWCVYTFIAKGLTKVADLNLDGGEKIELMPVSFDELIEIGSDEDFYEKEVSREFLQAKYDPEKRKKLEELFKPSQL